MYPMFIYLLHIWIQSKSKGDFLTYMINVLLRVMICLRIQFLLFRLNII